MEIATSQYIPHLFDVCECISEFACYHSTSQCQARSQMDMCHFTLLWQISWRISGSKTRFYIMRCPADFSMSSTDSKASDCTINNYGSGYN